MTVNSVEINKSSYDKIAGEWASIRSKSFVSKLVVDFADKVNPKGNILDIGCGSGYLTKYLCERNFHLTGIDISGKMIEIAKIQVRNADFSIADFFDFIPSRKFDGILAWDSCFHFPKERQKDFYVKVKSLLNTGGYLLFTHGNAEDEHTDEMMGEPFYYSCLPKDKVCENLFNNGFTIEYVYEEFIEK